MNKRIIFYIPILIAVFFSAGLYLGKKYFTNNISLTENEAIANFNQLLLPTNNKLQMLLYYIEQEYVDSLNKDSLIEKAINSLLQNLDPHSVYIPAEEFNDMNDPLEGEFEGIGIEFSIQNDTIVVMNTIIGGPSEKIGLLAGDRIIKVNDSLVAGIGITNQKVLKLLKGPKGTKVKLHIKRNFLNKLLTFTITRDKIPMHSIDVAMSITPIVGYIKIARFAKTTPEEFRNALQKLHQKNIHKIIVDVRGNGGGYMDAAIEVADEFLDKDELIVYTQGKAYPKKEYRATEKGIAHSDDIVILQDMFSASASEILAGAIQDNDRGVIIGQRSFGKGLVQEPIFFSDRSSVRLTIARYYTPSGRCIQREYHRSLFEYYNDILTQNDSIHKNDTANAPVYTTKKGRKVYGNGGIYPDIFVNSYDTQSEYFYKTASQSLIYQFAFQFADKNRTKLQQFKNWNDLDNYLIKIPLYDDFVAFTSKNGITASKNEIEKSKNIILNQLRAYIIRNIFNDEGFYAITVEIDPVIQKAIQYFNSKK
ncbi:MAG: S41 family peptidase [Bacteroidales bacterium]|nr:S41 family peptidase [Bacteroidales bacterium]